MKQPKALHGTLDELAERSYFVLVAFLNIGWPFTSNQDRLSAGLHSFASTLFLPILLLPQQAD